MSDQTLFVILLVAVVSWILAGIWFVIDTARAMDELGGYHETAGMFLIFPLMAGPFGYFIMRAERKEARILRKERKQAR